jgi:hypothetical protein
MWNKLFVKRCQLLGVVGGHGFPIDRTTHLLWLGADPWIITVIGWWASSAFLLNWCEMEVMANFIN